MPNRFQRFSGLQAVLCLPCPDQSAGRYCVCQQQVATDPVVSGPVPDQPEQERHRRPGAAPAPGRVLPQRLAPGAEVYSDGLGAFRAVAQRHSHTVAKAPPGKAGTEVDGARWVNVVLGNLKRSLDGTRHAFGFFKYAERAAWRFNRPFNLKALVPRPLVTAAACSPWPESPLRNVPVYRPC